MFVYVNLSEIQTYFFFSGIELGLYTKVSFGVLLSLVVTTSILGNILVITAIWTDKSLRKVKEYGWFCLHYSKVSKISLKKYTSCVSLYKLRSTYLDMKV